MLLNLSNSFRFRILEIGREIGGKGWREKKRGLQRSKWKWREGGSVHDEECDSFKNKKVKTLTERKREIASIL